MFIINLTHAERENIINEKENETRLYIVVEAVDIRVLYKYIGIVEEKSLEGNFPNFLSHDGSDD